MIEVVATFARWGQLAANMVLLGSCVFLAISGSSQNNFIRPWIDRVERMFPWLAITILIGLLLILVTTAGQVTGNITNVMRPDILLDIVTNTQVGHIWLARISLALLLVVAVFYLKYSRRTQWRYLLCGIIAALPLIAGSFASHIAAEEFSIIAMLIYALHIILAGIWLGALPAFLIMLFVYIKKENNKKADIIDIQTLKRFSSIAFPVMLLILATGIFVADLTFDDRYAALVATPYGWLLDAKLVLLAIILMIAAKVRSNFLPKFVQNESADKSITTASRIKKWVRIEFVLALGLILFATILSNTTPAKVASIDHWPFSFRLSFDATWGVTSVMVQFWIGVAIFFMAFVAIQFGRARHWNIKRLIFIPMTLIITSFAVALPPIAIEAYPETYRRTPVPFDAVSIANGSMLFNENCVTCHGPQGKGNGILSRTMSTMLPDMLVEPHVETHTAGDLYHWITYGMKDTDMPGYAEKLTVEEDRWDLVNYFHALYRGYQARIIKPEIVPNKPFIVPPSFYYGTQDGTGGVLQDFREENTVLLVFFSWPESSDRLTKLSQAYQELNNQDTVILAVPIDELDLETAEHIANIMPFPVVTQGAAEIVNSYALFRRTLSNPDIIGTGKIPQHMEFLIDRYGYLRARWIPSTDESYWSDISVLTKQIKLLNQERMTLPVPDDYIY